MIQIMLGYLGLLLGLLLPPDVPLLHAQPTAHIALVVTSGYLLSRPLHSSPGLLVGYSLTGLLGGLLGQPDSLCFSCGIVAALVTRFSKLSA